MNIIYIFVQWNLDKTTAHGYVENVERSFDQQKSALHLKIYIQLSFTI